MARVASLVIVALLAAAPAAAAVWSDPGRLMKDRRAGRVVAGTDARGGLVAVWQHDTGRLQRPSGGGWGGFETYVRASVMRPDGRHVLTQVLSPTDDLTATPALAVDRRGGAAAAWTQAHRGRRLTILASTRVPAGRFSRPQAVGRSGRFVGAAPRVATNARGEAVLLWARGDAIAVSLRRPGRRFGAPQQIPARRPVPAGVAMHSSGRAWAAWVAHGQVFVAERAPGRRFSPPRHLNPSGPGAGRATVAAGPDGTAVVAWSSGGSVHAAVQEPGGDFGAAQSVAAFYPSGVFEAPAAVVNATGEVVLAFTRGVRDIAGDRSAIDVATRPRGGAFGPPRMVSAGDRSAELATVSGERSGTVTVAWREVQPRNPSRMWWVAAAVRFPGMDFEPAQRVAGAVNGVGPPAAIGADSTTLLVWQPPEGGALVARRWVG